MEILNLEKGIFFQMGKGQNWRVVHPDMGAEQITLNHSKHDAGHEFPQHTHGNTEDVFVILDGGVSVRQGEIYTPVNAGDAVFVPAGEVHGTVNTTDKQARLISFQAPPDMALYRGERNVTPNQRPKPQSGHISSVQISSISKGGPIFGKPGNWRSVVSKDRGAKQLALNYIEMNSGMSFDRQAAKSEEIYVLATGKAEVHSDDGDYSLEKNDVIFLKPGDNISLSCHGSEQLFLIHCWAQPK
ncbi:cupin domain-containing protein [Candidatus Poribacteria bacterium]|nr:cupin domain-containing protein [Candidatus Poribacteria bacterium]